MKRALTLALAALLLLAGCSSSGPKVTVTAMATATETATYEASEEATDDPLSDQDLGELLGPEDFEIRLKVLEKQCFGSAGCNVTFRINPSFVGVLDMPSSGETEVTYKIKGGDEPLTNTFTIDDEGTAHFDSREMISTARSSAKLKAVVTDVEWNE